MRSRSTILESDVCVVGAGIVGLAHAHEARRRGLSVVVLDRDDHAVGASVRNFGHLFFTSVADHAMKRAEVSRERWLQLGARAGMFMQDAGTLVVATHADEMAVLEAVARDPDRHCVMLSASEVTSLAPVAPGGVVGGLHATRDLRADPRRAVAALAQLLSDDPGATMLWGAHVHDVEPGLVHCDDRTVRARAIVVCPGPAYGSLPPALRSGLAPLTLCRLQMLRLAAPTAHRYPTALVTGLSLIRYPAFASRSEASVLRDRLEREKPELLEHGIHLLVTQLPDGDLIVGDTHEYADTMGPFGTERLDELLLAESRSLLGDGLTVRERWHGIYPTLKTPAHEPFFATTPMPGVRVVENVGGIGMTLSFGQAPITLDELLSSP